MKIERLFIEGFRSFVKQTDLMLCEMQPGLYLVAGSNEVEKSLQGNGAGKSSLFEAIHWALFGRTSRGVKAGSVRSWGSRQSCTVALRLDSNSLVRNWQPNVLEWNDQGIEQAALEAKLGLTPAVAANTFLFSQGQPMFVDREPRERMDVYSSVLGLGLWEEKSDKAKRLASEAAQAATTLEIEHAKLQARAETLAQHDLSAHVRQWDAQNEACLLELQGKVERLDEELQDKGRAHEQLCAERARAQRDLQKRRTAVEQAQADVMGARGAYEECRTAQSRLLAQWNHVHNARLACGKLKRNATCPECGQHIDARHLMGHMAELQAQEDELGRQGTIADDSVKRAGKALAAAETKLIEIREQNDPLPVLQAQCEAMEREMDGVSRQRFQAAQTLAAARRKDNPFAQQKEREDEELARAREQAASVQAELQEVRSLQARFEFWVRGFKDVRYQVMQESLAQLNAEANECLHELGLAGWQLMFSVEKETKTGGVKRGFMVDVKSPHTGEPVPWEAWSGGESQRLRLAAQLGVSNMLCARMGQAFNVEMWDEPSNYLSPAGIKDLLGVLRERAQRYARIILVADHRALDFAFDGRINIVKDAAGSRIVEAA